MSRNEEQQQQQNDFHAGMMPLRARCAILSRCRFDLFPRQQEHSPGFIADEQVWPVLAEHRADSAGLMRTTGLDDEAFLIAKHKWPREGVVASIEHHERRADGFLRLHRQRLVHHRCTLSPYHSDRHGVSTRESAAH